VKKPTKAFESLQPNTDVTMLIGPERVFSVKRNWKAPYSKIKILQVFI
jgi:hypothetical protein